MLNHCAYICFWVWLLVNLRHVRAERANLFRKKKMSKITIKFAITVSLGVTVLASFSDVVIAGNVVEYCPSDARSCIVVLRYTDSKGNFIKDDNGNIIGGGGVITPPVRSKSFPIPETRNGIPVDDVEQTLLINRTGQKTEVNVLVIKAKDFNNQLENIFDALENNLGSNFNILVPDVFADINGDGEINGEEDVLYSLVDLNQYAQNIPSFEFGDSFNIVNGIASGLPGMLFGTQPIIFNPGEGFLNPTPYSGIGFANSAHGLNNQIVPEPSSTVSLLALCTLGAGAILNRKLKTSYADKELEKIS